MAPAEQRKDRLNDYRQESRMPFHAAVIPTKPSHHLTVSTNYRRNLSHLHYIQMAATSSFCDLLSFRDLLKSVPVVESDILRVSRYETMRQCFQYQQVMTKLCLTHHKAAKRAAHHNRKWMYDGVTSRRAVTICEAKLNHGLHYQFIMDYRDIQPSGSHHDIW